MDFCRATSIHVTHLRMLVKRRKPKKELNKIRSFNYMACICWSGRAKFLCWFSLQSSWLSLCGEITSSGRSLIPCGLYPKSPTSQGGIRWMKSGCCIGILACMELKTFFTAGSFRARERKSIYFSRIQFYQRSLANWITLFHNSNSRWNFPDDAAHEKGCWF